MVEPALAVEQVGNADMPAGSAVASAVHLGVGDLILFRVLFEEQMMPGGGEKLHRH